MAKGIPQLDVAADIVVTAVNDWPEPGPQYPEAVQIPGPRTYAFDGCYFQIFDAGGPGVTDIRVMDLARKDLKNVKWRDVEKMCKNRGIETVPIIYRGPGGQAPEELLAAGPFVAFRLENRGPWMLVRQPVRGGSYGVEPTTEPALAVDLED